MTLNRMGLVGLCMIALTSATAGLARAGSLVLNGGFESTTNGNGQLGVGTNATDWASGTSPSPGYNFLFAAGSADTTGAANLYLWGPGAGGGGVDNGLTASSPAGGNFVALGADPSITLAALTQTITGLTAQDYYSVGFYWAGAQQTGAIGATTDQLQVGFGSETLSTAVVNNVSEGFTGWMYQNFTFQADGTSDVLSFLAVGSPSGLPPFVLLDDVSVNAVPEPSALVLMGLGLAVLGGAAVRRHLYHRRKGAAAAAA